MLDPVTLAVLKGRLDQIVEEMDIMLVKLAFSQVIAEQADRASGVYHPKTGETIAQGITGLPIFVAAMQFSVQAVLQHYDSFQPGDLFIFNDPYLGGTHLPDMKLVKPVFFRGELVAFLANTGHWQDIGGLQAGGFAVNVTEIYHDGIRVPPIKLYDADRFNEDALKVILANVRNPWATEGDLKAQLAALKTGETRFNDLLEYYGTPIVREGFEELLERSERQMRSYIREIPDGTYSYADCLDNDGLVDQPLYVRLDMTVNGDSLHFDFSKSDPPARGPFNLAGFTTISTCNLAIKHLFPDVPVNGGCFRALSFNIPDSVFIGVKHPYSVSGYLEPVGRVIDVVFGAMGQALPDRTPAASFGTTGVTTFAGRLPGTSRYFFAGFPYAGGYGGTLETDGLVHGTTPLSMASFPPIEGAEHRAPILVERLEIREDSGGPGRHRGGCGTRYIARLMAPEAVTNVLGDRVDHPPFGVLGGLPAQANKVIVRRADGEVVPLPMRSKGILTLRKGDTIECNTPGGGGYGDPLERDATLVLQDVISGHVSPQTALDAYAVSILLETTPEGETNYQLDGEATSTLREERRKATRGA